MTPEGYVKADIRKWLDWLGWWYFMPVKHRYGRIGIPDFIVCAGGPFLAIEAKRVGGGRGTTARQDDELAAIHACGGRQLVCTGLEQLKDYCYADESIRAQLPSRGCEGEPQASRGKTHAAARTLRI